ncbi:serine hydrolase [Caulobacter flavus]|uniref:Serine hydrolase n=1 Tax=Caulobacter flavus TaxID=1679497 RepID=A0A2N5CXP6_9CAUL|nr:serine hydrolase domain-containing protein [Caulobacter flavus]AYV47285.1 serine hydrolase [Caulobacter flavus]PLR18588.1 serine hydrolase [Caulobacter flavus]
MTLRLSSKVARCAAVVGIWLAGAGSATSQSTAPTAAIPTAPRPYAPAPTTAKPRTAPAVRAARPAAPAAAPQAAAPPVAPALPGVTPLPAPELEAFVDGFVRRSMNEDHIAGVTVSVVQNGQVVLKKGYGVASVSGGRRVDPDRTLFRIGSISKTFTWIALQNEIDAGRIRPDTPINVYLPEKLQVRDQGKKNPVRVRDLYNHTPGFEDRALGQLFERDERRIRPLDVYLRQERPNRVREPGVLPAYSNYGVALVGAALANTGAKPFEDLIAERVITPAGLTRTTFREPRAWRDDLPAPMAPALAADMAEGYRWTPLGLQAQPIEFIGQIAPAGSASSTAADMARYMTLLLNGGAIDGRTVFSARAAQAFRTPSYRPAAGAAGLNSGFQDIALPGNRRGFGHAGATLWFHSNMVIAPDLGLGVFVSVNTDTGQSLPATLPSAIVERFYAPARAVPAFAPLSAEAAALYEGDYLTDRRAYGGLEGFVNRLIGVAKVRASAQGGLAITTDGHTRLWIPTDRDDVFKAADGADMLVFQREDGTPTRFFAPSGVAAYERVGPLFKQGVLSGMTLLAALASIATLAGVFVRSRRDTRQTTSQARASLLQTTQAVLWLAAIACVGAFALGSGDVAAVVFGWPSGWLLTASACAFIATLLTLLTLAMVPVVWRGGRRVDSWTDVRKLSFTVTALIFIGYAVVLAAWGFLEFWNT